MCEYCVKIGEGQLWYLNPKHYTRRMYRVKGRIDPNAKTITESRDLMDWESLEDIIKLKRTDPEKYQEKINTLNEYWGAMDKSQVVPLKDMLKIIEIGTPIAATICICRWVHRAWEPETQDDYPCAGMGMGMLKWERWPERYHGCSRLGGLKWMSTEEAKEWVTKMDEKGCVHSIAFEYGSLTALCNCSYPECLLMKYRLDYGMDKMFLKSHYVAMVDPEKCNGCRRCVSRCYFGALRYNPTFNKITIDPFICFGCGLCETVCKPGAVTLKWRESIPSLKDVW